MAIPILRRYDPGVGLRAELTGRILGLEGVELRRSRFTGDDAFFAGRREVAHFHGDGELDVRIGRSRSRELPADRPVTRRGASDWCEFAFARRGDLDRAVELVALSARLHRSRTV